VRRIDYFAIDIERVGTVKIIYYSVSSSYSIYHKFVIFFLRIINVESSFSIVINRHDSLMLIILLDGNAIVSKVARFPFVITIERYLCSFTSKFLSSFIRSPLSCFLKISHSFQFGSCSNNQLLFVLRCNRR